MKWILWTRDFLNRKLLDRELEEELADHLARETEHNIANGMPPDEARRRALRSFGELQRAREECRSQRHGQWFDSVMHDVRFAFRMLNRSRTFTAVAVATRAEEANRVTFGKSIAEGEVGEADRSARDVEDTTEVIAVGERTH